MKLTEKLYDKVLASCRGGFLGLTWGVCDANGEALDRGVPLKAGMFIVAENYYGDVVLHVNDDMSLTTCEVEYEDLPVYMPTVDDFIKDYPSLVTEQAKRLSDMFKQEIKK